MKAANLHSTPALEETQSVAQGKATILVLAGSQDAVKRLAETLHEEGFDTQVATNGREALADLADNPVDGVILDLPISDGDGPDLCWQLRELTTAPILVLSEGDPEERVTQSLEMGADAHLSKPCTSGLLMGQLYALLRRVGTLSDSQTSRFTFGQIVIDLLRREITVGGRPARLTRTQFDLLSLLLRNAGRALSYRSLARQVLGYDCEMEEARDILKVHIHHLRNKIEPNPAQPSYILTVPGFGYLFERRTRPRPDLNRILT